MSLSRPLLSVSLALSAALSLSASPVVAESSSWFSRDETVVPKLAPAPKKSTPEPGVPPTPSDMKTRIPSLVPATGDDAAYTAFDQGQYLTAMKLAQEAAARGEPQANTLIGRIYREGLGVP
ncbi:MAG TPA: hypothetical protein PKE16_04040, partial [Hyphomicrobium sp.]|nr:hypothetical protein [Hyphomicrobium sp.]